jgi:hypothetical protein
MSENRKDRELETRQKSARAATWQRPETLPSPDPKAGWEYRWIRVSTRGEMDPSNVSVKLREGWEPVKATDHPEIELVAIENGRFKDNIVIGGLMLCRAPTEMLRQRAEYFNNQVKNQLESVDNNLMKENNPKMPLFSERKSSVTFGTGN